MIAAIYARKSTDQSGVADEARSVTRQIEHARAASPFLRAKLHRVHVCNSLVFSVTLGRGR